MKLFAVAPALLVLISLCGSPLPPVPSGQPAGYITLQPYIDSNRDGTRDAGERLAGEGVYLCIAELDSGGAPVNLDQFADPHVCGQTDTTGTLKLGPFTVGHYAVMLYGRPREGPGTIAVSNVYLPSRDGIAVDVPLLH